MGKAGRNEVKRVAANFFNGAAVAVLAAGCFGPAMAQQAGFWTTAWAVLMGVTLHVTALRIVSRVRD